MPTQCGELKIREPPRIDHASLFAEVGGCIPLNDDGYDSFADLIDRGLLTFDDSLPITCELAPGPGNGSGDFDQDADTPDTMPPGITLDTATCTTAGAIPSTLAYGIYGFTTSFTQSTSASTASTYVPYCTTNMTEAPNAYSVVREDNGSVATLLPVVQQLNPGESIEYGTDAPDPKVTVDRGMPCMSGSCYYAFVFRWKALSSETMVSGSPNAFFPVLGPKEGFTHGIQVDVSDSELLALFEQRASIVNIVFDYCIADNNSDCGNDEADFAKRAAKVRQNGNGSNYYFSLVLLPAN